MPTKAQKIAAIEKEYQELLEAAEAEGDTPDESEILVMRVKGKKKQEVIDALTALGVDISEAEEIVDEITDEVLDEDGNPVVKEEPKKTPAKKVAPKKAAPKAPVTDPLLDADGNPKADPEPPSSHRFFGGKKD